MVILCELCDLEKKKHIYYFFKKTLAENAIDWIRSKCLKNSKQLTNAKKGLGTQKLSDS